MTRQARLLILILALALPMSSGCRWVKQKLGMGTLIVDPEKGSPEWVVQRVLEAAHTEPFAKAFSDYSAYLHSDELDSVQAMKEWETLRFPALRRKHECFLRADEGNPYAYELMEDREKEEDYRVIFVKCKTSDMPTPCNLIRDPNNKGEWRIKYGCLN